MLDATERLVRALLERNAASGDDLISMLFTVTDDIRSAFPAEAARRMGLGEVPLMCAREIPVLGSMPSVVRVLMHLHTERTLDEVRTSTSTGPSRCAMTSSLRPCRRRRHGPDRHLGRARRGPTGAVVTGWDVDAAVSAAAGPHRLPGGDVAEAPSPAPDIVVVARRSPTIASRRDLLRLAPDAVVTDAGSVKPLVRRGGLGCAADAARPVRRRAIRWEGASGRGPSTRPPRWSTASSGRSPPHRRADPAAVERWSRGSRRLGARPVRLDPDRHDRLVAIVSHLPQVASTALMGLAATEEADEPEILLLAAGGFRDLTRLAASNPALWSDILLANRTRSPRRSTSTSSGSSRLRDEIVGEAVAEVEATFDEAKAGTPRLAAKPHGAGRGSPCCRSRCPTGPARSPAHRVAGPRRA